MLKKILILCLLILMAGCGPAMRTVKEGVPGLEPEKYDLIKKGKSTKADILEIFGEPLSRTSLGMDSGETWIYTYSESKTIYSLLSHESDATVRSLVIHFDQKGKVRDFSFSELNPLQLQEWEWK